MRWTTGRDVPAGLDGRLTVNKNLAIIVISAVVVAALVVVLVMWPGSPAHSGGLALRGEDGEPGAIDLSRDDLHQAILLQKTPFYRNTQTGEAAPFTHGHPTSSESMELVTDEINPKAFALLDEAQKRLEAALAEHPNAPEADRAHACRLLAEIAGAKGDHRADEGDDARRRAHATLLECEMFVDVLGETHTMIEEQSSAIEAENPELIAQIRDATSQVAEMTDALDALKAEEAGRAAAINALEVKIAELREAEAVLRGKSNDDSIRAAEAMEYLEDALVVAEQVYAEQDNLAAAEYELMLLRQATGGMEVDLNAAKARLADAQTMADSRTRVSQEVTPAIATRRQEWDTHHAALMTTLDTLGGQVDAALAGWNGCLDYQNEMLNILGRAKGGNDGKVQLLQLGITAKDSQVCAILSKRTMLGRLGLLRLKMEQAGLSRNDSAVTMVEAMIEKFGSREELTDQAVALCLDIENDYDDILASASRAAEPIEQIGQAQAYVHLYELTGEEDYRTRAETLVNKIRVAADKADDPVLDAMLDDLKAMLNITPDVSGPSISLEGMSDEEQVRYTFDAALAALTAGDYPAFGECYYLGDGPLAEQAKQQMFALGRAMMELEEAVEAGFGPGEYDAFRAAVASDYGMPLPALGDVFPEGSAPTSVEFNGDLATVTIPAQGEPGYLVRIDGRWRLAEGRAAPTDEELQMIIDSTPVFTAMFRGGIAAMATAETYDDVANAMMSAMAPPE
jgi:hypothetical protein